MTRLRGLPRVTQRLLLVAAADPVGDRVLLARAAHTLNLDVGALELAVDAGLLDSGAAVRFRHRWPKRPTRNVTRTGELGIAPTRRTLPMRRWPPS